MIKGFLFILLFLPSVVLGQYLFNKDTARVLYKGFTNSFICKQGTPLCFDGSVLISPSDVENTYYIEVLDTVSRNKGKINIAKYLTHPDGYREKVFIDKFSFQIIPLPETILYLGLAETNTKIDTSNLNLRVGIAADFPETRFRIKEFTAIANKKVLIIKSSKITPQAIAFIKSLPPESTLEIEVIYIDPLDRTRRIHGEFLP